MKKPLYAKALALSLVMMTALTVVPTNVKAADWETSTETNQGNFDGDNLTTDINLQVENSVCVSVPKKLTLKNSKLKSAPVSVGVKANVTGHDVKVDGLLDFAITQGGEEYRFLPGVESDDGYTGTSVTGVNFGTLTWNNAELSSTDFVNKQMTFNMGVFDDEAIYHKKTDGTYEQLKTMENATALDGKTITPDKGTYNGKINYKISLT